MNVKAFKNEARLRRGTSIFSDRSYGGLEWSEWYKLAAMTRGIEYGCRFAPEYVHGARKADAKNEHFKCAAQREHSYTNEECCCSSCESSLGYLKFIPNNLKTVKIIAKLFRPEVGFWRKDKGCVLPRKYRSAVCLGFRCGTAEKLKIYGVKGMLVLFMDSIRIRRLSDKNIRILGRALLKTGS